ncbi:MAG TPA: hypothetical protein VMX13_06375 [Sedimentisphaerales bacterium]|nr:hypothetical protein [Sedimentisphaerales bacterium]
MRARICWISGITFLGVMLFSGMLYGVSHWEKTQVEKYGSSTLKGLESVSVSVSLLNLSEPAEGPNRRPVQTLTQSDLQTEVELILRSAGIPIHQQSEQSFPGATFFVNVVVREHRCDREHKLKDPPGDLWEFGHYFFWRASANLHQSVALSRQPEICTFAQTWPLSPACVRNELNVAGREAVAEAIREEVGKQVREFTNDYLAANPKEEEKKGSLTDEDRSSGIPDEFAHRYTWMLCRNPACRNSWQMNLKEYWEMVEKFRMENSGVMENPAATCPKCGEPSGYIAVKCEKCGLVFEKGTVPRDFEDRCPKCNFSKIEERRAERAARQ